MSTEITCGIKLIITYAFLLTINTECNITYKEIFKTSQYVSGHIPTENFAKAICILTYIDEHTDYMWYQDIHILTITINIECNIIFSVQNCECNDLVIILLFRTLSRAVPTIHVRHVL